MNSEIIKYYDELALDYDENRFSNSYGKFIDKSERKILTQLLSNPNEIILDLACGSGRFLNFATLGVDASKEMIEVAQSKFPLKTLYIADATKIPLEEDSVDTIISFHLFMHLDKEKIDEIISECNRILKPNGRIIFDFPSKKRRKLINYKTKGWHGSFSLSLKEIETFKNFEFKRSYGILLFPIHRFPKIFRPLLSKIDAFLSNSFLKEYSSYLIVECLKKKSFE